jgi:hypothetical protein
MPDFNVRSDSVNVEQIMEQIRERVREKRGVDYTEQQIRELAAVKLEKFLDPRGVRSDLLDQFRHTQPDARPNYAFEAETLFETHRAPIRWIRRLLRPVLKLLFNPNPLIQALHIQAQLNTLNAEREAARHSLYFEVTHNLVVETTRLGIEVKNLTMRLESLASRLEFNERRARALESVVAYRSLSETGGPAPSGAPPTAGTPATVAPAPAQPAMVAREVQSQPGAAPEGPGQRSRRRRRRRGRRGGAPAVAMMGGSTPGAGPTAPPRSGHAGDAPAEAAHGRSSEHSGAPNDEAPSARGNTAEPVGHAIAAEAHPSEPQSGGGPHPPDSDEQ